jgi:hypothetical protein
MVSLAFVNRLHTVGSLHNAVQGPAYRVKDCLFNATLTSVTRIVTDGSPAT